ncbi:MAG: helicase [Thaumarchaeota archaeon]|nr:helicase [Nitrososphaerota archaeon]
MREILLSDLVRHVLGPRDGCTEQIEDPASEYITGMLAPADEGTQDGDDAVSEECEGPQTGQDDQYEAAAGETYPAAPALNPKSIPSTMGLSFFVDAGDPRFEVCVSWARYERQGVRWVRRPFRKILKLDSGGNKSTPLQHGDPRDDGVLFHYSVDGGTGAGGENRVSMFVENRMNPAGEKRERAGRYVFQPQIRVLCAGDTKIVPGFRTPAAGSGDATADLIYKNRPFLAKGHLTSAVWREIDPERDTEIPAGVDAEAAASPPFRWADGDALPEADRKRFSPPDVRTEYVPTCSVPAPALEWDDLGLSPAPGAWELADMYDPDTLRGALYPLANGYMEWIRQAEERAAGLEDRLRGTGREMAGRHRAVHRRIVDGIETLLSNGDARLAFCFANKAMNQQRLWTKGKRMAYRPFQLAFILAALESVINPKSQNRDVCDLLWVPTGAGKTEAYLAVAVTALAYRRLVRRDRHSGAGVSVITRYTLRLLTIQQFRRTLSVISAAEYLRVYGLGEGRPAGWRPAGCTRSDDFIWGAAPFSAGLWVGESLTPNRITTQTWRDGGGRIRTLPGAIDMLKGGGGSNENGGDPAQVTECPACPGILAVPEGGLPAGKGRTLHWVVRSASATPEGPVQTDGLGGDIRVSAVGCRPHRSPGFFTLSVKMSDGRAVKPDEVEGLWRSLKQFLESEGTDVDLCPVSPTRPGYFIRHYETARGRREECDFDIVCPNPDCPLRIRWAGGSPQGKVHGRRADAAAAELPGHMVPEDVVEPFQYGSRHVSDRVPIKAFTVDEQVYREAPSVVVATVDKFARLPFEPKAAALFGNVSFHHCVDGYVRRRGRRRDIYAGVEWGLERPDLVIQDELHLIEGPLGSMVGAYESAVDFLSSGSGPPVKYVASTATISNPEDHVRSITGRNLMLFPPLGANGDRFLIRDRDVHQLDDAGPGRLYAGVCCPGRGPLTPMIRIWARLAQTAYERREPPAGIDRFWTLAGYFNSVREMAGIRAAYMQDIPEWLEHISPAGQRRALDIDASIELSSRTGSARLPSVLDMLDREYRGGPGSVDALFTTSMFGTGVDVSRIGLMLVNGQPKTTTSYIQATGRVGRQGGALVVTFLRASRPRDLNHYEFFSKYHLQLHRFVEPVTAYPFASGMLYKVLGPVALGMLRNMRTPRGEWDLDDAGVIKGNREAGELGRINGYLKDRAAVQPGEKRPAEETVSEKLNSGWDKWVGMADGDDGIVFRDYSGYKRTVVLGGQQNRKSAVVFADVPTSLRELEDETEFAV